MPESRTSDMWSTAQAVIGAIFLCYKSTMFYNAPRLESVVFDQSSKADILG